MFIQIFAYGLRLLKKIFNSQINCLNNFIKIVFKTCLTSHNLITIFILKIFYKSKAKIS